MVQRQNLDSAIVDTLHIDEDGLKDVKVLNIAELGQLGITDVPAFLDGVLDSENDKDVESFNEDYIKGYRYGKTGKF